MLEITKPLAEEKWFGLGRRRNGKGGQRGIEETEQSQFFISSDLAEAVRTARSSPFCPSCLVKLDNTFTFNDPFSLVNKTFTFCVVSDRITWYLPFWDNHDVYMVWWSWIILRCPCLALVHSMLIVGIVWGALSTCFNNHSTFNY